MFLQVYGSPPPAQSPARLLREEGFTTQGSCFSIFLHAGPHGCNPSQHPGAAPSSGRLGDPKPHSSPCYNCTLSPKPHWI